MSEDLSNIFEEADHYLKTALVRWRRQLPELYEDAFQEGMIQVWRDVEAGVTPKLKVLRRASMAANKFCHRNGEYFYGKPRKSREGVSSNSKTREKVQVFLDEYMPVHGNSWPMAKEIAEGIGITPELAGQHLRNIKAGKGDFMKYREDGRKDWDYYKVHSVEAMAPTGEDGNTNRTWHDDLRFADEFESSLIGNLNIIDMLSKISKKYQEVIYMHFVADWTTKEIGEHVGTYKCGTEHQGANKRLNRALDQLRMSMGVFSGACPKKHERSEDTCEIVRTDSGDYFYRCKTCKNKPPKERKPVVSNKGVIGDPCSNGHTKDKINSAGYAKCSICLKEAQQRYREKRNQG